MSAGRSAIVILMFMLFAPAAKAAGIALGDYTCAQFLSDRSKTDEGEKALRSLLMVAWATGFAAAYRAENPRSDDEAIGLIAALLENECKADTSKNAVAATASVISRYAQSAQLPAGLSSNSTDTKKFRIYDNRDIPGVDLRRLEKVDLQNCEAACGPDNSCHAFSYDKWNRWCFLKSGVRPLSLEPSSLVGVKASLAEPEMSKETLRMDRRVGKSLAGKPYRTDKRQSWDACEANCLDDQRCLAVSFVKMSSLCKAFDRVEAFGPDATSTSGIKTQTPP